MSNLYKYTPFFSLGLSTILFVQFVGNVHSQSVLQITEFQAANSRTLKDEDGDSPDWIEIFNTGNEALNLQGWHLTDDASQKNKWRFPDLTIHAKAFVLVFASGKDRKNQTGFLHTNFKLRARGEYLGLIQPDGVTVEYDYSPEYPDQKPDFSYGLFWNPPGQFQDYTIQFFNNPTPGGVNQSGFGGLASLPEFSHKRGFYSTPFNLRIRTRSPDAEIYYTLDGSEPTSKTGTRYLSEISIDKTTTLQAAVFQEGFVTSQVVAHTFLFLEDVIKQSPDGLPPEGFPLIWGNNSTDYGMDPEIVRSPEYRRTIIQDLQTIPSFSLVMDQKDLFSFSTGIYSNPKEQGKEWERSCSLELIHPDGKQGFQINCGIRIRGGISRSLQNSKHAFRFFFRSEYGAPKLNYPLFGKQSNVADSFDQIDLRTFQNYSWSFLGSERAVFLRDQLSRDNQAALGQASVHGDYYHLYINGQYWGLYNTNERPKAPFAASYFGGKKEDYDVVKVEPGPYITVATDGNLEAWQRLWEAVQGNMEDNAAYFQLQGLNPDGSRNPQFENLLDVGNLIDYMLVIFYGGDLDAPISSFLQNAQPNNFYSVRSRKANEGFRFLIWDGEHTYLSNHEDRTDPENTFTAGNQFEHSNPQWLFHRLEKNLEFRMKVADHVHRHFFNNGALTEEAIIDRLLFRKNQIDRAVVGESARWGDAQSIKPKTRDGDWIPEINRILNEFIPRRSEIVVSQLQTIDLYPLKVALPPAIPTLAPDFNHNGGAIRQGFRLTMSAPIGSVFYTVDGSDPRLIGGDLSDSARVYESSISLEDHVTVKSRTLNGSVWSPLNEASFQIIQTFQDLMITEIMFNPKGDEDAEGKEYEFIELKNTGTDTLPLSGIHFAAGIQYTFPPNTFLAPNEFSVLVSNRDAFLRRYPETLFQGVYQGQLDNNGELIQLLHAIGTPISSVRYSDDPPWPQITDGFGFSLESVSTDTISDPTLPESWRPSIDIGGSPGWITSPEPTPEITINEILSHTDPPQVDAVELHNSTAGIVDLTGWFLTDDLNNIRKFRIPEESLIAPNGFIVFDENDFNPVPGQAGSFALSSHGEQIHLFSADPEGNLTGYHHGVEFGASPTSISFGRITTSTDAEYFPLQIVSTLGARNLGPSIGPVIFTEIHYNPDDSQEEFLELKNVSNIRVPLFHSGPPASTWAISGIGYHFPQGTFLEHGEIILVVPVNPEVFKSSLPVAPNTRLFGPYPGRLNNQGESLQILRPGNPDIDASGNPFIPFIIVDALNYEVKAPWPIGSDRIGRSLERISLDSFGNDPAEWRSSFGFPTPGYLPRSNRAPFVDAGNDQDIFSGIFPVEIQLNGQASDDGLPANPGRISIKWQLLEGPASVVFEDIQSTKTPAHFLASGVYRLQLQANDGRLQSTDELIIEISRPQEDFTFIPLQSDWKYLDTGINPGPNWALRRFDDGAWKSGPAQLGYGDGDERTIISFGPNASNKFITSYFRYAFTTSFSDVVESVKLQLLRDDGAVIYLNGTEIFRSNLPAGPIGAGTTALEPIGGDAEGVFVETDVDPGLIVDGLNVLAAEIHQDRPNSSDISFDLLLFGATRTDNQKPMVNAGPRINLEQPGQILLSGSVTDDGLPSSPGFPTILWSQVSGPGEVQFTSPFSETTAAILPELGIYLLRLTATDGEFESLDEVLVSVGNHEQSFDKWRTLHFSAEELLDESISGDDVDPDKDKMTNLQEFIAGTLPTDGESFLRMEAVLQKTLTRINMKLRFNAIKEKNYTIQFKDSISSKSWKRLIDVPAPSADRNFDITLDLTNQSGNRLFRVITPKQP